MLVTTGYKPDAEWIKKSQMMAEQLGAAWIERNGNTITRIKKLTGEKEVLVVSPGGIKLHGESGNPFFYHPSMAYLRVERLHSGENDALIELANICPGDRVLDCTAGMAADALVFAYAVGDQGRITALESEKVLYHLVSEGLNQYSDDKPYHLQAMRRIEFIHSDHLDYLRQQPTNAYDIVYFDPMFREPMEDYSPILPLRSYSNRNALSKEAVEEAKRVASRAVILKERYQSGEFERLGFQPMYKKKAAVIYGVIAVE